MRPADDILSPDRAWRVFTRALKRHLEVLERGQFLIIDCRHANRFVQVAADGYGAMLLESVSNQHLEPLGDPLTERDFARLDRLGWHRPTQRLSECIPGEPRTGSPNFWREVEACIDFEPVARLLVSTLRDVHQVFHPRQLEYEAFHRDEGQLLLPMLGVPRRRRPPPPSWQDVPEGTHLLDRDFAAPSYGETKESDDIDEGCDEPR